MPEPLEPELRTLESLGLIRPLQAQADLAYLFRHALIQEAAYESLTRRHRQALHLAIGQILESLDPDRRDEVAELLAYHFAAAGDGRKASIYGRLASQRALSTYSYDEAIVHLQRALELPVSDDAGVTRRALFEDLGDIYVLLHQGMQAIGSYQQALSLWAEQPAADRADAIRLHRKVVQTGAESKWAVDRETFRHVNRAAQASGDSLDQALELIHDAPPHPETVRLLAVLSLAAWRMRYPPDWETAAGHARAAVRMADQLEDPVEQSVALEALSNAHFGLGDLRASLETAEQRLEITSRPGFAAERQRLDALRGAACAMVYVGEYERALPLLHEAEGTAERMQSSDQIFNVMALLTQCWFRLDRWDEIRSRHTLWEDLERRFPQERTGPVCWPLGLQSIVYFLSGDTLNGAALRDRSYGIMLRTFGPENWLRNAHY
jgi:hypothetical protein